MTMYEMEKKIKIINMFHMLWCNYVNIQKAVWKKVLQIDNSGYFWERPEVEGGSSIDLYCLNLLPKKKKKMQREKRERGRRKKTGEIEGSKSQSRALSRQKVSVHCSCLSRAKEIGKYVFVQKENERDLVSWIIFITFDKFVVGVVQWI